MSNATATATSKRTTKKAAAKKPVLADLAEKATAPSEPETISVVHLKLTGLQPEQMEGRKGKPFRPNSQRAVMWDFMQAQLAGGPRPEAELHNEAIAKQPAVRTARSLKEAGKMAAPSGWYGRYLDFGLLERVTLEVPKPEAKS